MAGARSSSADAAPGLSAVVVYLRPAPRARLLGTLADLGIFVTERQQLPVRQDLGPVDLCLVVGDESDAETVQALSDEFSTVVVCLPSGARGDALTGAGALCYAGDGESEERATLRAAAHRARALRTVNRPRPLRVFGDLDLQITPPALCRGDRSLPLSHSERDVLRMLASALGRPVPLADLERGAAAGPSVHPGFLKAVVLRLRRKVAELGGDPELLRTVRGFGYSLIA